MGRRRHEQDKPGSDDIEITHASLRDCSDHTIMDGLNEAGIADLAVVQECLSLSIHISFKRVGDDELPAGFDHIPHQLREELIGGICGFHFDFQ